MPMREAKGRNYAQIEIKKETVPSTAFKKIAQTINTS